MNASVSLYQEEETRDVQVGKSPDTNFKFYKQTEAAEIP